MIDGLVDRGIGIQVGSEFYADGLTPRHDAEALALAGKVLRTVEGHVLQKMGQSTLAGLLQDTTHALGYIEVRQTSFLRMMTNVIGHAVLQLALTDGWILWQRLCHHG